MKFLFEDESFSFETLRATGFAVDGGADLADVLVTTKLIDEGDEEAWCREWNRTADRIYKIGQDSLAKGHRISARESFLRASNYYRVAEFYRRADPLNDAQVLTLSRLSREAFLKAGGLLDGPFEEVSIPYEGGSLPGYLFLVDGSGTPRPTVVYNNGFDSTREESYCAVGAAALRRGYNVLAFDGPGQGSALKETRLVFRPDWEAVMTPVLNYAVTRSEIAEDKIALFGYSLGAYLVARSAAFDPRAAAIIMDDGMFDFFDSNASAMPPFIVEWIKAERDDVVIPIAHMLMKRSTSVRWALQNGVWTFGAKSIPDYIRQSAAYTLRGIADKINAPTLIMEAEGDAFLKGQPQRVAEALRCPRTLIALRASEGAEEHCHMGAMRRAHQVMFDWLDETLL